MLNTFGNHRNNQIFTHWGILLFCRRTSSRRFNQNNNKRICAFFKAVSCISDENQSAEMMECFKQTNGMPRLVQECMVPCRDDCIFTTWSKFTPCSMSCETTRSRRRQLTGRVCLSPPNFR